MLHFFFFLRQNQLVRLESPSGVHAESPGILNFAIGGAFKVAVADTLPHKLGANFHVASHFVIQSGIVAPSGFLGEAIVDIYPSPFIHQTKVNLFGETPNDTNLCGVGVVFPDVIPVPAMQIFSKHIQWQ